MRALFLVAILGLLVAQPANAGEKPQGIVGLKAPAWEVDQWFNLPEGKDSIDVTDLRGKVIYLFAYQSWSPGCFRHGFPTLKEVMKTYADSDGVVFVAVQTAFEGFPVNTASAAVRTAEEFGLEIPFAHDGTKERPSRIMQSYRTGGTPWTVIIDREGIVRFNGSQVTPESAGALIDRLLDETVQGPARTLRK